VSCDVAKAIVTFRRVALPVNNLEKVSFQESSQHRVQWFRWYPSWTSRETIHSSFASHPVHRTYVWDLHAAETFFLKLPGVLLGSFAQITIESVAIWLSLLLCCKKACEAYQWMYLEMVLERRWDWFTLNRIYISWTLEREVLLLGLRFEERSSTAKRQFDVGSLEVFVGIYNDAPCLLECANVITVIPILVIQKSCPDESIFPPRSLCSNWDNLTKSAHGSY
jgi:hypothetical protein